MRTSSSTRTRRLLVLFDGDFVGGAEVNYLYALPELDELDVETRIAAPGAVALESYFDAFDIDAKVLPVLQPYRSFSAGGRIAPLNLAVSYWALRKNLETLKKIILDYRPQWIVSNAMISHLLLAHVAPYARRSGVTTVVHLQDIVDRSKGLGAYGIGLDWIVSRVDHVISISNAVSATLPRLPSTKVTRLVNPVATGRRSRGQERDILRVGMFARYTPWKGHDDFLKIAESCSAERIEFVSHGNVSIDDRHYFEAIRTAAAQLPNAEGVRINGFTANVLPAMAGCDVVLHLSRQPEPFGRILIEANAVGVPVFAYRGGGVDETFREFNLAGLLFDNGDWQTVTSRLLRFRDYRYIIPDLSHLEPSQYARRLMNLLEDIRPK